MATSCMKMMLIMSMLLAGIAVTVKPSKDTIYYISLNRAVHLGHYDGSGTVGELKEHGDFGLGSQEKLARELILVDGKAYGISADGSAVIMDDDTKLAFAAAKFFEPDMQFDVTRMRLKELQHMLDKVINTNRFAAIRIKGRFHLVEHRCYVEQHKPYKPLSRSDVKKTRSDNTEGTLVGFYTPMSSEVLNSPEYHFHFVNTAGSRGGHMDNCIIEKARVEIDYAGHLEVQLPSITKTGSVDLARHY